MSIHCLNLLSMMKKQCEETDRTVSKLTSVSWVFAFFHGDLLSYHLFLPAVLTISQTSPGFYVSAEQVL